MNFCCFIGNSEDKSIRVWDMSKRLFFIINFLTFNKELSVLFKCCNKSSLYKTLWVKNLHLCIAIMKIKTSYLNEQRVN